jgi:WD40 repeat protein
LTWVVFSDDGRRLLTADADGRVQSWNVANGSRVAVFRGHSSTVTEARFSPDGRWVVTAGPSAAGLFHAATGTRLYFLRGHGAPLTAAAFMRNSRRVVSTGTDGTVRTYVCVLCGDLPELRAIARQQLRAVARVGPR